ncbi:MAG: diaminopimelate epimerase [Coprobacillaceae bacterium]
MELLFTKMEGLGNDYIYIDGINQNISLDEKTIQQLSERHFGIGSDGVIIILSSDTCDFKMRMFNQNGSEAMMCGNGIRCFAKFCYDHQLTDKKILNIETKSGLRVVELVFDKEKVIGAKVNMGKPILKTKQIPVLYEKEEMINEPIVIGKKEYLVTSISMGNPHAVTFVDNLDIPLEIIGPVFEHHTMFPNSVNTEFVQVINESYVKMRVWERGSGETMACGTGACAVMYASYINGYTKDTVTVELLGGKLEISYQDEYIYMRGPATTVYEGKIEL